MTTDKHRRAFISYSRTNKEFATKLTKGLRTEGFPVWFDLLDIPTGARWDDEVEKALRECSIFLVILTPASIASENVKDEIGYAIDHGKRILPVLLEDCDVPLRLRRFQYVDFTTKSFEEGFESAKDLLGDLVEEASMPVVAKAPVVETQIDGKAEAEQLALAKAETERKAKEEADRLAVQKAEREAQAEAERLALVKAETEREAKRKQDRKAKEKAKPVEVKTELASAAPAQKKPMSKGLVIGIVVVVVLVIGGLGFGALSSRGTPATPAPVIDNPATEVPVVNDPAADVPVVDIPATEAPVVATEPPSDPNLIFGDDFSDPNNSNSNWGDVTPAYFENGKFYIVTPDDATYYMYYPAIDFSQYGPDLAVQMSPTYESNGLAGVYCREQNNGAFYLFQMVFDKSLAQIWYYDGSSNWNMLAEQSVTLSSDYNYIYAVCQGNSLTFYWNGEYAVDVTDDALPDAGQVGLYIELSNPSGSTIEVDDFYVVYP